jgi:hypothetical protein
MQLNPEGIEHIITRNVHPSHDELYKRWVVAVWAKYAAKKRDWNGAFVINEGEFGDWRGSRFTLQRERARFWVDAWQMDIDSPDNLRGYGDTLGVPLWRGPRQQIKLSLKDGEPEYRPGNPMEMTYAGQRINFAGRMTLDDTKLEVTLEMPPTTREFMFWKKDGLIFCNFPAAHGNLRDTYDWWVANRDKIPKQVTRLSVDQVEKHKEDWHASLRKSKGLPDEDKDIRELVGEFTIERKSFNTILRKNTVQTTKFQVFELKNTVALQGEGDAMRNCLASYSVHLLRGHSKFYAIIGPSRPQSYTMQVTADMREIAQIRSFANRTLEQRELLDVMVGLRDMGAGFDFG